MELAGCLKKKSVHYTLFQAKNFWPVGSEVPSSDWQFFFLHGLRASKGLTFWPSLTLDREREASWIAMAVRDARRCFFNEIIYSEFTASWNSFMTWSNFLCAQFECSELTFIFFLLLLLTSCKNSTCSFLVYVCWLIKPKISFDIYFHRVGERVDFSLHAN